MSAALQERSTKFAKEKKRIEKGSSSRSAEAAQARHERKVQALQAASEAGLLAMETSFKNSVDLLIEQYEDYMEGPSCSLCSLSRPQ